MILTDYSGCSEDDIMKMSKTDLQRAVIRMMSVKECNFQVGDSCIGTYLLPDQLADAFRGYV